MKLLVSFIFISFISGSAHAQTACPVGVAPGSPQCGPDSGTSRGDLPPPPPRPTGEWLKTWGAIVNADGTGRAWASTRMMSKDDAEKDALDQCASAGFNGCRVTFAYQNQCVAVSSSKSSPVKSAARSGPDLDIAKKDSVQLCSERGGGGCHVIYTDCTEPVFRKF
ncbi:DUF4189 domain-containing protein [Xanthomonas cucurbitae]|uniref:DUF4189 domain-containing protein n=2 Tax=Xanthomonas TaxID=338 RepID=A0ABY7Y8H4_9XANT|nr:DUF4189 domain-containing protein [Xanthomonas cucurbitae]WDM66248.1 DUF4189 domain-containing protein [Xanthomonas cucurbitae]WDM70126.1 DUF4189 domain-containing protein [Xanthomonas cucurbitae]